jgi:CDP-paratose 2-epimerase
LLRQGYEVRVPELRTGISWADWHNEDGKKWYDWLLPKLAGEVAVLPCFHDTPPCLGIAPRQCSPPRNPKEYADFLDVFITRFGDLFEWVELWNQPKNPLEWNTTLDPQWLIFCEMVGGAAHWARKRQYMQEASRTVSRRSDYISPEMAATIASLAVSDGMAL